MALVLLPVSGGAQVRSISSAPVDLHSIPPGPRPFPVKIAAYLIDVERMEESTGTYALAGYLTLEWNDTRLSREAAPAMDRSHLSLQDIWWPNIEFFNQNEPRTTANLHITVNDDGTVIYEERFRVKLGSDFDFRRFPFDHQRLLMQIESFRYDSTQMSLTIRQSQQLKNPGALMRVFPQEGEGVHSGTRPGSLDRGNVGPSCSAHLISS
jgi:hypothetical protein